MHEPLDDETIARLLIFLRELRKWNKTYNLTAITDPEQMVVRHLLDSASVLPWLPSGDDLSLLDVGAGAGLPGLVLAACRPRLQCVLLDRVGKKVRFMRHAAAAMQLDNVQVVHQRIEDHLPDKGYDVVIARAFAVPEEMARGCAHALAPAGALFAMCAAVRPQSLHACAGLGWQIQHHPLTVPGLADRNLVVLHRMG